MEQIYNLINTNESLEFYDQNRIIIEKPDEKNEKVDEKGIGEEAGKAGNSLLKSAGWSPRSLCAAYAIKKGYRTTKGSAVCVHIDIYLS